MMEIIVAWTESALDFLQLKYFLSFLINDLITLTFDWVMKLRNIFEIY